MDLRQWKAGAENIRTLKVLLSQRKAKVRNKIRIQCQVQSLRPIKNTPIAKQLIAQHKQELSLYTDQIHKIDQLISELVRSDEKLSKQCKLIQSVPGAGKVIAWAMIAKTEGFTTITEPRKMGCYAGVVPFEHQSGTSVRRKPKVSPHADRWLKSSLHLGAMSAIRLNNDLRDYYQRKIKEGKSKMSVLNAIRNKIIHRIFAVIREERFYEPKLVLS